MNASPKTFLERYEYLIPITLFVLFMSLTLPGIAWGAPDTWHPDEIVIRALNALEGNTLYNEINFDYPALPHSVMYWLGRLVAVGGNGNVLLAARLLSATLAGLTVVLTYILARQIRANVYVAGLAGLLLIGVSEMPHNGRFAHNDAFLAFFVMLAVLALVNFQKTRHRAWLYASFLAVGLAASSKYNGIALVLAPGLMYLFSRRRALFTLRTWETLILSAALTFGGYVLGTTQALTSMVFYFKRMIPALLHTGNYLRQPDSVRGYIGQYASLLEGVGWPLFILFISAVLWALYTLYQYLTNKQQPEIQPGYLAVILLSILALDLPIMISYNYPMRFFLSIMPLLAVLGALFSAELYRFERYRTILIIALSLTVLYSLARDVSVMFLFINDQRIPASAYLRTLPTGTSLEHTYYPPTIPADHFEREHNYPIYFRKSENDTVLSGNQRFEYNVGEIGLDERETTYFVVDGFTTEKFDNPYTCSLMQVECDFFKQLASGESDSYRLIAEFSYTLPPWLPQMNVTFVNPSIRIYERKP